VTAAAVLAGRAKYALHHGECLAWLDTLPAESLDAVVCDPPYAEIDRDYGRMSEAEWETFAHALVRKSLRVLKPRGSAVFIIQPNSERVGRMRAWVFRFLAWCADDLVRETNGRIGMVQDAWWWNTAAMPTVHTHRERGLMRPSLKPCAWIGPENCHRDQDEVLWTQSQSSVAQAKGDSALRVSPSGFSKRTDRINGRALERGGTVPFNVLPIANTNSTESAGASDHGAGTPYDLAAWWVRYLCPKGGVVADPCGGTMTMGLAAVRQGRRFLGCEQMAQHFAAGVERMASCDLDATSPIAAAGGDYGPLFGGAR
jgi:DNA modification methylase